MAAVTTAVLGTALTGFQAYQGFKQKEAAEDAIDNFKRTDLANPYENMQVSTVGSDALREQSSVTSATLIDSLAGYDSRAIFGNLPKIQAASNNINKQIQIGLDDQVTNRNYAIAGDKVAQRKINEDRDNADLAGLGNLLEVGNQNMWNGLRGVTSALNYGANNINFSKSMPKAQGIDNQLVPAGVTTSKNLPTASLYNPNSGY